MMIEESGSRAGSGSGSIPLADPDPDPGGPKNVDPDDRRIRIQSRTGYHSKTLVLHWILTLYLHLIITYGSYSTVHQFVRNLHL
jgi:hypothetical protein